MIVLFALIREAPMRTLFSLCCLLIALPALAADLVPDELEVGQTGQLRNPSSGQPWNLRVREVIDAKQMIVALDGMPKHPLLIKGHPTKGLADGKKINLAGTWKVTGTKKYDGRTYYVVEPAKAKD